MKRISLSMILTAMAFGFIFSSTVFARRDAVERGSSERYVSKNGRYSAIVEMLDSNSANPCLLSYLDGKETKWKKEISTFPGRVDISDNGKYLVLANWGWYDEGGYKSFTVYNYSGERVGENIFGEGKKGLKWIRCTDIAPDGSYYVIATDTVLEFYDVPKLQPLWSKKITPRSIVECILVGRGQFVLAASSLLERTKIMLRLFNKDGVVIWEKNLDGFCAEPCLSVDGDGNKFLIFYNERSSGKFIMFIMRDEKVINEMPLSWSEGKSIRESWNTQDDTGKEVILAGSDEEIKRYVEECIRNNDIFFFSGGYAPSPLVEEEDADFVKKYPLVDLGCTGPLDQGKKFNKFMIERLRNKSN